MELFHSLDQAAAQSAPSVVTIGAFDGIHLAHLELLRLVRERAAQKGAVSVAITFEPHPLRVLAPQKAPKLLTPHPVRLELLAASGVDRLLVLPFTRDFSLWPPEKFVEEVLAKALRAVAVVVGDNFRFGYRAAGDITTLAELGKKWNFETQILPAIHFRRMPVSSSQIRSLLEEGRIERANRLLGRPFSIRQTVESGLGIGRSQTVPTLNLAPYAELLPATGVYITETRIIETRKAEGAKKGEEAGNRQEEEARRDREQSYPSSSAPQGRKILAQGVSPGFKEQRETSPAGAKGRRGAKELNPSDVQYPNTEGRKEVSESASIDTETQRGTESRQETDSRNPESGVRNRPGAGSSTSFTSSTSSTSPASPWLRSVTNVGYRPTFVERSLGVETHLLEPFEQGMSDQPGTGAPPARIEVHFLYRLRDERKFNSPEELKAQILRDIRRSQSYFRRRALLRSS